uniref:G_PROTEIN_RECEP_F1_2 domain-containing protein n=1 Tax=Elaeophora elaphi TaxID=1147741 RepID=A0A0R3RNZ0_9BILA
MNSVERLCVVAYPIYYYTHSARISYSLIAIQYVITIVAMASTTVASLIEPTRLVSDLCLIQDVFPSNYYEVLLLLTSFASLLSVVIMTVVVVLLGKKFGAQFLSNNSHNSDLSHFLNNQKRYTKTSLISCCFTFCINFLLSLLQLVTLSFAVLVVAPSVVEEIYRSDPSTTSHIIAMCCIYTRILNSFNLVLLFLYHQRDVRST